MSSRNNKLYISDILESIDAINDYLCNVDFESFCNDRKTYSATIREFIVIGEAISKVIDLLQESHPEYPWRTLKDFRYFIVHEYFGVNPRIIYDAGTLELEELKRILLDISNNIEEVRIW